jgi:hypothetical protein
MFRVGVAALVFVASFHPPVHSHKADRAPGLNAADTGRFAAPGGCADKVAAATPVDARAGYR